MTAEAETHFDVVVVGSGFGGSVTTYRLADGGKRVCLLERGRPYPPGSFPRSPRAMATNLWDPGSNLFGMFDVWAFRGLEGLVSSGLGGGSLIYANVLLRKDERWFVDEALPDGSYERWPITRADLEPHYDRVEQMMDAQRYPFDVSPYDRTPKTRAMQKAAAGLGLEWQLPPLAVSFANRGRTAVPGEALLEEHENLHHRPRRTCRLCGECDIGCNDGAKNTLDLTYLSRAAEAGAEIRTLSEARRITPRAGGGYSVTYRQYDPDGGTPPSDITVTADRLILGAGAFGSTFLLLRNRSSLPHLSSTIGSRFSGNGDLLTFLRRARTENGKPFILDPDYGPVITSAIRVGDSVDGKGDNGRGFYIEDGGNPQFLDWLVELGGAPSTIGRAARFAVSRIVAHLSGHPRSHLSGDFAKLMGSGDTSSTALPTLSMGRDIPDGVMRLRDGGLDIDWTTKTSSDFFDRVEHTLDKLAEQLGAKLMNSPLWLFKHVITVHPLGGCPMGVSDRVGVVDPWGEVHNYPGLFVADGSAMPGPVGPNPSLTIAAFADRIADGILEGHP
jgi:cholesterol oxidase